MAGGVMILAGGTGGHVYPALAVAEWLRERGVSVTWMGTRAGLEARVVPAAGIPIEWVEVGGLRGKGIGRWLTAPLRLSRAVHQAARALLRVRPAALLGMGGFVAGPAGFAGWLLRIPLIIHEQNAIAGLTNRVLAPLARRVLAGYPDSFPARRKALVVGNPLRAGLIGCAPPRQRFEGRGERLRLLVLGGSLGARAINQAVPAAVAALAGGERPEVWHQCGQRGLRETAAAYEDEGLTARVVPFIDEMAEAYAWADLVLARAGAMTLAELAAVGVGAILVPYPYAVDDHQSANAGALVRGGAAELIPQPVLSASNLAVRLRELSLDRPRLLAMAEAAHALAAPDATRLVAEACLELAGIVPAPASGAPPVGSKR